MLHVYILHLCSQSNIRHQQCQDVYRSFSSQFERSMTHPNNDEVRASHRLSLDENDWTVLHALHFAFMRI